MTPPIVTELREAAADWGDSGMGNRLTRAADTIEALLGALEGTLPKRVCLTNRNIRDDMVVPLETTMGELRKVAAAIAKARS
jgi:hypothetical protein